jgi:hypothetical protein
MMLAADIILCPAIGSGWKGNGRIEQNPGEYVFLEADNAINTALLCRR